jgi:hypothetical protein
MGKKFGYYFFWDNQSEPSLLCIKFGKWKNLSWARGKCSRGVFLDWFIAVDVIGSGASSRDRIKPGAIARVDWFRLHKPI